MRCIICNTENKHSNIVKCKNCHHIFRNYPKINLTEYYSESYRKNNDNKELEDISIYKKRNDFIISKVLPFIKDKESIFEVGFGYGHFYKSLKEKLPEIKYSCCEISKPLAHENNKKGIKTFSCAFQDVVSEKFDVIASFDVLEHFYDPNVYVKKLKELLNVNGIAIIQVPTDRQIHFKNNFDGHYHYFSQLSLNMLLGDSFENSMWYKTYPAETAGGREFLTVFRRTK